MKMWTFMILHDVNFRACFCVFVLIWRMFCETRILFRRTFKRRQKNQAEIRGVPVDTCTYLQLGLALIGDVKYIRVKFIFLT